MDELEVISAEDIDEPPSAGGVARAVLFDTEQAVLVRSRVGPGVTTGWHHNGNRTVFGAVEAGCASIEYGPGGGQSAKLGQGDVVYVPPYSIRRVVNATDDDWVVLIAFVGSGPLAVPVAGPDPS